MQTVKDLYQKDCFSSKRIKVLSETSMNILPVLSSQFFKISYANTLKTLLFTIVNRILIVKSKIIIIAPNSD